MIFTSVTEIHVHAVSLKTRRIIFWLFFATFVLFAPLLVLYTSGYRYNFANQKIVRTGVLSITTDPRNVEIFFEDKLQKEETPAVIQRLMPGTYNLKLIKLGYRNISKTIIIESGATTILHSLLLLLDSTAETLFSKELKAILASPDGNTIAYALEQEMWSELWLYNLLTQEHKLIRQKTNDSDEIELSWSADGGYVCAFSKYEAVIELFTESGKSINTDFIESGDINSVFWNPSNDSILYITNEEGLVQVDLSNLTRSLFANTDKHSILFDASVLNFIDDGTYTELQQLINGQSQLLALLPRSTYTIAKRDGQFMVLTDDKNRLILLDIHAPIPILLETTATSFAWLENTDELLYSTGYEVNVYNPTFHTKDFLLRQSEKIVSILWHPSASYIFLQTDTSIVAIERIATQNSRASYTLFDSIEIKTTWVSKDGRWLYAYGKKNGAYSLFELELTKSLLSL